MTPPTSAFAQAHVDPVSRTTDSFLIEEFGLNPRRLTVEHDEVTANWKIATEQSSAPPVHTGYADKYGNSRLTGVQMMELIANNKPVQVNKTKEELEFSPTAVPRQDDRGPLSRQRTRCRSGSRVAVVRRRPIPAAGEGVQREAHSFVKPAHSGEHKSFPG
ncbi:hypothetical protein GS908_26400 [Rhodococcus hoagii]|nr:hypothetical protein [Prescottella equi]